MGLRKYINDLEFSKKVNYRLCGRKFENSDFARGVELTGRVIEGIFQEKELGSKMTAVCATLIFPASNLAIYGKVKYEKRKESFVYHWVSNSPDLILNH